MVRATFERAQIKERSMEKHRLSREFAYNGIKLPDPNPEMSLEQVREVHSPAYHGGFINLANGRMSPIELRRGNWRPLRPLVSSSATDCGLVFVLVLFFIVILLCIQVERDHLDIVQTFCF
jgi:Prokaryotic Ubiquitin